MRVEMSAEQLRDLLGEVEDTLELIVRDEEGPEQWRQDELMTIWSAARIEANQAYEAWLNNADCFSYAVYRAAEDRADAAQDALAASFA